MNILLSLAAIYQLLLLLKLKAMIKARRACILLCLSFLVLPFFSYTHPVAIAPVHAIVLINEIITVQNPHSAGTHCSDAGGSIR